MANVLKLAGNAIALNRNLSSGDDGVFGPFTTQATQNGMSVIANFNLIISRQPIAGAGYLRGVGDWREARLERVGGRKRPSSAAYDTFFTAPGGTQVGSHSP